VGNTTYQDLYTLVQKEILKNGSFPTGSLTGSSALGRQQVVNPVDTTTARAIVDISNISNLIMDLMLKTVPPQIKTGLVVTATDPVSNQVIISAGEGTVGGQIFTLNLDTTYVIPLADGEPIYYINLSRNGINMNKTTVIGGLTIAKIVVPQPGTTVHIRDTKDIANYPWDAWIVNMKEIKLWGNGEGKFEEDSIAYLKNNIGDILADQLIGNIRLSEDLKITNTQGSVEIDSKAVNIYDENDNKMAVFNRYGTYFYDTNGIELAKFSVDGAHIGNIEINKNNIQSKGFTSNLKGFRITDAGYAEFEDARIRGVLKATVFEKTSVSAVGGQLIVANATTLVGDVLAADVTITTEGSVFNIGDIVILKDSGVEEYLEITNDVSEPIYTVTRDLKGLGASDWNKGTTVVSTGATGDGYLVLDATSAYSPYMDVIARDSGVWNDVTTKVRLGNLAGINDVDLGPLTGYGLYSENAYLKGELFALTVKTGNSGSRIHMDTEKFYAYDDDENLLFQIFLEDISGSPGQGGGDVGDVYMGEYYNGSGFWWDASASTMWIRGLLDASDVTVGNMSVSYLSGGVLGESGGDIFIELGTGTQMKSLNFLESAGPTWGWALDGDGQVQMIFGGQSGVGASYMQSEDYDSSTGWKFYADNTGGDGDIAITMGTNSYIQSNDYVTDTAGWKLFPSGSNGIQIYDGAIDGAIINDASIVASALTAENIKRVFVWYKDDDAEVDTELSGKLIAPWDCTITKATATCKVAPDGGDILVDININGTTIFASGGARLEISDGDTEGVKTVFDVTAIEAGDELTWDIDAVGLTIAGQNLLTQLEVELD